MELLAALPGVATLGIGIARWRAWQYPERGWWPSSRRVRLVSIVLVGLAFGACHSIDSNVFAHSPVPPSKLAFHEPIVFSTGAPVPAQNGLLASYFAGADYERLDHQQFDPNVNFTWDATGNPVISAPDGIDHNDGDFRLPDSWGIWSVVWEGYLEVPAADTYGLRIHVNNGGWLQLKDSNGGLTVVIDCAGGTGFEGDCEANTALAQGRNYIRLSYFNNAPPSANAFLSWRPPGAADFTVIPTESLFTQAESDQAVTRAFLFVHGIKGNFRDRPFEALMKPLRDRYGQRNDLDRVQYYEYHQDVGHLVGAICASERDLALILPFNQQVGYPADFPVIGEPRHCDSNDDIGVNGLFLERDVRQFARDLNVQKVTLISNSMGAAIVRAYLAYASATRSDTLAVVDQVVFLQGVQQGTYVTRTRDFFDEHPVLSPIRAGITEFVRVRIGIDAERPAFTDLAPESRMIQYVNQLEHVPSGISYLNVRSDIRLHPEVGVFRYRLPLEIDSGDYLILPGDDNPTHTPPLGGAGVLPSIVAIGRSSGQWTLRSDQTVFVEIATVQVPTLIATQPESHLVLGSKLDQICVATLRGNKHLDRALFDAITVLDVRRPTLELLEFGDLAEVPCR